MERMFAMFTKFWHVMEVGAVLNLRLCFCLSAVGSASDWPRHGINNGLGAICNPSSFLTRVAKIEKIILILSNNET